MQSKGVWVSSTLCASRGNVGSTRRCLCYLNNFYMYHLLLNHEIKQAQSNWNNRAVRASLSCLLVTGWLCNVDRSPEDWLQSQLSFWLTAFKCQGKYWIKFLQCCLSYWTQSIQNKNKKKTHKVNDVYKNSLFYLSGELTLDLKHSTKKTRWDNLLMSAQSVSISTLLLWPSSHVFWSPALSLLAAHKFGTFHFDWNT